MLPFRPNPDAATELMADPLVRGRIADLLEEARSLAQGFARPIMPQPGHDLVEVVEQDENVYLVATAYGGHIDEFGTAETPPNAPLRRGAEGAGLEFEAIPLGDSL